jgi:hypothetical protein
MVSPAIVQLQDRIEHRATCGCGRRACPTRLYDESKQKGWIVISMKNDWNEVFPPTAVDRTTR